MLRQIKRASSNQEEQKLPLLIFTLQFQMQVSGNQQKMIHHVKNKLLSGGPWQLMNGFR